MSAEGAATGVEEGRDLSPCRPAENGDEPTGSDRAAPPPPGVLGLPAPRERSADSPAPRTLDVRSGESFSLDALGPVVVNVDGTMARIGNWAQLTPAERAVTQRRIAARNNERLAALRAANTVSAPLD